MMFMPKNSSPKPNSIVPYCRTYSRLARNDNAKPAATSPSAAFVTLKATIWAVMVVPMLAPMITPTACVSVISPAEINPITSTVVTEDDWMIEVTIVPARTPVKRLEVRRSRILLSRSPATTLSPLVSWSIP